MIFIFIELLTYILKLFSFYLSSGKTNRYFCRNLGVE